MASDTLPEDDPTMPTVRTASQSNWGMYAFFVALALGGLLIFNTLSANREAAQLARDGKEIKPRRNQPLELPEELQSALSEHDGARRAFENLTPGKRREYADHVASAKRAATRLSRVEKILPMIESGVGLNDRYR